MGCLVPICFNYEVQSYEACHRKRESRGLGFELTLPSSSSIKSMNSSLLLTINFKLLIDHFFIRMRCLDFRTSDCNQKWKGLNNVERHHKNYKWNPVPVVNSLAAKALCSNDQLVSSRQSS